MLQAPEKSKKCSKCIQFFDLGFFNRNKRYTDGHSSWCKSCHKKYVSQWQKKNKEKCRINKTLSAFRFLDLSKTKYLELISNQNNSCAICNKTAENEGRNLAIDHCHKTNKFRGLLCHMCNRMLGMARDNIDILEKAILYLKEK